MALATAVIVLVTKPFSLFISLCRFFVKAGFIVLQTGIELVRAAIGFHVNLFWKTILWVVSLISLPARVLNALQRERLLEQHLHKIQYELETLLWDREQLEDYLQAANKECRIMESMLAELEEENDKAIAKIELLEGELRYLSAENLQLKEIQGKAPWSFKCEEDASNDQNTGDAGIAEENGIPCGIPSLKSSYKGSSIILQDLMNRGAWEGKSKRNSEMVSFLKTAPVVSQPLLPFMPGIVSKDFEVQEDVEERREVALSQSVFSATLSLLVGMVIWESDDPCYCMPLVVALFIVVGISLKSVVQFFSTVKSKPASDAVALLSFNWFILGALTYPTLPVVAHMLARMALSL